MNNLKMLTKKQMLVVEGIVSGLSAKMVASKRGVSVHTINNTLKKVYRKLGINSNTELAMLYYTRQAPVIEMFPTEYKKTA